MEIGNVHFDLTISFISMPLEGPDHEALRYLNQQRKWNARHAKWVSYLQELTFVLQHKSEAANKVADAFSRKHTLFSTLSYEVTGF